MLRSADPRLETSARQPWWIARVQGLRECRIADRLERIGVPYLLPMARYDRRDSSGKREVTDKALFPGYLFLTGEGLAHVNSPRYELPGLFSAHPVPDVPGLILDLVRLMDLIEAGATIIGEPIPIEPGESVRVTLESGIEFEGSFIRSGGRDRVCVAIRAIGQMRELTVESWRVERIAG
jgi:hypothetical protein